MNAPAFEHASIWRRVIATGIDFIIVPVVSFIIMIISGAMETAEAYANNQPWIRGIALGITAYLLLNGWLLFRRGQTVGKWITRIRLVGYGTGETPPIWRLVCIRALFFPMLYLPILYPIVGLFAILPIFDLAHALRADRRCLHDLVSGTRVIPT